MAQVPLAFSIHNFISSVGADAGFAAIIGLAILILLYFAHARETANLREEAALLTQRLVQAEARVAQLSRAQTAPVPAPAVQTHPAPAAPPWFPFAPAGVGAPALAAATRVVALAGDGAVAAVASQPEPAAQPAAAPVSPAAAAYASAPEAFERPAASPVAAPPAATVAGGNGAGHDHPLAAPIVTGPPPPLRAPARPAAQAGYGQLPPLRPPSRSRSRFGRGLAALIGAAGIAAVIAVLVIATAGGTTSPSSSQTTPTTNAPRPHKPAVPPFSPSAVTVAVLNGTNVNQLAHTVGAKLAGDGYKEGPLQTAASQSHQSTVVAYFPGAANRNDALHVATALKLKPSVVQPIDSSTEQVACSGSTMCANVVVTVGADLSTL
jgi:LytR cell envelope-related transcriptional attenuator